jgi:hypothetical protein
MQDELTVGRGARNTSRHPGGGEEDKMQNTIIQGDCLNVMETIPDCSIDMILCDLPYGTTACKWDAVIPLGLCENSIEEYVKIIDVWHSLEASPLQHF